jgi:PAS domain S-box-containing protein
MPSAKDAERTLAVLAAEGLHGSVCEDLPALCREIRGGAGTAVLTEGMILRDEAGLLAETLREQPAWSAFPLVVLTQEAAGTGHSTLVEQLLNVTLVERPVRMRTLLSVVKTALRSRRGQYEVRAAMAERERQSATFDTVLAALQEFVYVLDPAGRFTFVNQPLLDLWGKTSAEALGRTFAELGYPPELVALHTAQLQQVLHTRAPVRGENAYTSPSGNTGYYENTFVPLFAADGSVEAIGGATRNVTERRLAEQALRESEIRFRQLADAMPQIVWTARPDGYTDYFNERWYELTGEPRDVSGDESWLPALHPDDLERTITTWQESVSSGSPYTIEYRLRDHRTDEYRWHLGRALPARDTAGNITKWFGSCTDIHAQKLTAQALVDADRRKDEFLAMLSHELRNPLSPIVTAAHVLKSRCAQEPLIQRQCAVIQHQIRNMSRLLDDLLDLSRVTHGTVQLQKEPLDLSALARQAIEATRELVRVREHTLEVDLSDTPLPVTADRLRLEQVMVNLLNNAAKYTDPGGQITVRTFRDRDEVVLQVADTGIGMSAELLPRIFDLFTQGERGLDRSQGGLGIGLTLVKNLIELHGGSVRVESPGAGRGSRFTVRLPAERQPRNVPASSRVAAANGAVGSGRVRRVLIVDDNRDGAEALAELLGLWKYDTRVAFDGGSALALAADYRPDAVILDIGMPGMDGYETARRLREDSSLRSARLIALTGYGRSEDRERARSAGFDVHLTKPLDPQAIHDILEDEG